MSRDTATPVAVLTMVRQHKSELERVVQALEREDPKRNAAAVEKALGERSPVAYGEWKDETPNLRSRLRAVQRWRSGSRGRGGSSQPHLFPYLWPVGERQRKEVEPEFSASPVLASGSWRMFLYNCSPEVVRDVRVTLDQVEIDYAPSILVGRFVELHWQRIDGIRSAFLAEGGDRTSRHTLAADFVIAKGTRQARIGGEMTLDTTQGWVYFGSLDGRKRELE
ncbi:MAG: hypothetical protein L3J86_00650 [Thermoplasmata archaeon]|nr:hypothetical protein [Thermoplasmata archaeon]